MIVRPVLWSVIAVLLIGSSPMAFAEAAPHDKSYWLAIVQGGYTVPAGATPFALAQELSELLGSPDPELRDQLAFSILSVWLNDEALFTDVELTTLLDDWQVNLRRGTGGVGSDAVLQRSFSALCLAALVERDSKKPFLDSIHYRGLIDMAFGYLASERDLRGFDAGKGWIHATAHTADLLAALARHPRWTRGDQARLLAGVAGRLSSAPEVFTQGEQDRLAQAVTAAALRTDFDAAAFDAWLTGFRAATRTAARTRPTTPASLAIYQNNTYFLQALYARLSMETLGGPAAKSRASVLDALRPR